MRTGFVLTIVVVGLALGITAGVSESRLFTRALVIGLIPALWAVAHLLKRVTGRDMWLFTAPYPYRRGREAAATELRRPGDSRPSIDEPLETSDRPTLPFAA
jgi:hypothetical protein